MMIKTSYWASTPQRQAVIKATAKAANGRICLAVLPHIPTLSDRDNHERAAAALACQLGWTDVTRWVTIPDGKKTLHVAINKAGASTVAAWIAANHVSA